MTEQNGTKAPADKICAYEYTVKRGDSFYLIAHRLGVPLRDLLAANAQVNPARLMVGDVLCIPLEEDDKPQEEAETAPQPTPTPEETAPEAAPAPQTTPAPQTGTTQGSTATWPDTLEEEMAEQNMADGALDQPASPGEGPVKDENTVCPRKQPLCTQGRGNRGGRAAGPRADLAHPGKRQPQRGPDAAVRGTGNLRAPGECPLRAAAHHHPRGRRNPGDRCPEI